MAAINISNDRQAPTEGLARTAMANQCYPLAGGFVGSQPGGSRTFSRKTRHGTSSAKIVSAFSRSARTDTAVAAEILVSPLLPRAPAASTAPTKPEPSACVDSPDTSCDGFDDLLATCISTLGVPGGRRARESLRCVLQAWGEKTIREKTEVSRPKQGRRSRRSKQRPSLPAEARGNARYKTAKAIGLSRGTENSACDGNPLAVCGSQVESSQHKERLVGLAEAAAARWERRYSLQVSTTEEALLAVRNAKISIRELERVLDEERAGAARAAQKAAAEALAYREEGQGRQSGEPEGGATTASLGSVAIQERCQAELHRRLQETQERLAAAKKEAADLRQALEKAQMNRSLQPVVIGLGQVLTEGLASLGLVRGVPDGEFHACVSALRDRAEEAGKGFLSAEELRAAADGARALDASRTLRAQLHEALLDASRQRARRIEADARLMEKRAGEAARETVKEDVVSSQKAAEETRARLAVATAEVQRLRELLKEERERSAAAWGSKIGRAAPLANVRGIFEEGHRLVQAKMKIKAQQLQRDVMKMQEATEIKMRELREAPQCSPRSWPPEGAYRARSPKGMKAPPMQRSRWYTEGSLLLPVRSVG